VTKLYLGDSRLRTAHFQLESVPGSKKKWEKVLFGHEADQVPDIGFLRPKCHQKRIFQAEM
jgi:hypothetical protein